MGFNGHFARQQSTGSNVRFGSKADIGALLPIRAPSCRTKAMRFPPASTTAMLYAIPIFAAATSAACSIADLWVVDAHVDGRHAAAGLPDQRPIGGEIDQRRENAAMGETTLDADHPFLAPFRTDLN